MPGIHVKLSVAPGTAGDRIAAHAARRIEEHLGRHPGEDSVPLTGEPGEAETPMLPHEAVHLPSVVTRVTEKRCGHRPASHHAFPFHYRRKGNECLFPTDVSTP